MSASHSSSTTTNSSPAWFGEVAQNLGPQPIIQVFFMLVYGVWWPIAWPTWGSIALATAIVLATYTVIVSVRNIRHSRQFENIPSPQGIKIGKQLIVLSAVTYPTLWAAVIALALVGEWRWILPVATLIIGLHFFPLAHIFDRRIDYVLAPISITFALAGMILAADPQNSWQLVYAIAGTGGALVSGIYAITMLRGYASLRSLA